MKTWIHLIYLSIIAGLSYLLWQQPAAITPPLPQQANTVTVTTDTATADRSHVQRHIERTSTVETVENSEIEVAEVEGAEAFAPTEQPIRTEHKSLHFTDAEMAELLKKTINVDKVKELLHTEAVDQDWAYAMQDNLQMLYDDNESLHRATLNHIECYTTVCEVQFTNTDAPIDFMSNFHQKMVQAQWYGGRYQSVMMSDSETQTQTFYIVRSD
jgi:hypothetical protein